MLYDKFHAELTATRATTPSTYLTVAPHPDRPGRRLLYGARRPVLVSASARTVADLMAGTLPADEGELFGGLGIVVADRAAEQRSMARFLPDREARETEFRVSIILDLACNFACPYCYEAGLGPARPMSPATARDLGTFLRRIWPDGKKTLRVDFYGGEPLLRTDLIRSLAADLGAAAGERGAAFKFGLVTNGALLTRKTVSELVPLGLFTARVTLDGPPEHHDRSRPFKTGAGSFHAIVENLRASADPIRIAVSGNFREGTWRDFPRLLDLLGEADLGPDRLDYVKFDPVSAQPGYADGARSIADPWLPEAAVALREAILSRGYRTTKPGVLHCMVERDHDLVVDRDGTLYKCPAMIGRAGCAVGTLKTGQTPDRTHLGAGIWKNDQCLACPYLPLCFGGCRYTALLNHGDPRRIDCFKPYLDETLPAMLGQMERYRGQFV